MSNNFLYELVNTRSNICTTMMGRQLAGFGLQMCRPGEQGPPLASAAIFIMTKFKQMLVSLINIKMGFIVVVNQNWTISN